MTKRIDLCKQIVARYANRHSEVNTDIFGITEKEVRMLWYCEISNGVKIALKTTLPDDLYYEITYNGDTGDYSLEVYKRVSKDVSK